MLSLSEILQAHGQKYPRMQPRDAVKLLYQNEFGGGHLIRDEEACLTYLHREYDQTPQIPGIPLLEEIGDDMVRVHLGALDACGYTPEQLGRDFIRSANARRGSMEVFQKKLALLEALTAEGKMPFSPEELEDYLIGYRAEGCPMVSHSPLYREAYHPAYRVLHRRYVSKFVNQE